MQFDSKFEKKNFLRNILWRILLRNWPFRKHWQFKEKSDVQRVPDYMKKKNHLNFFIFELRNLTPASNLAVAPVCGQSAYFKPLLHQTAYLNKTAFPFQNLFNLCVHFVFESIDCVRITMSAFGIDFAFFQPSPFGLSYVVVVTSTYWRTD